MLDVSGPATPPSTSRPTLQDTTHQFALEFQQDKDGQDDQELRAA
jgi:hypothetical protein